jgi:hypothetical protein
VGPQKIAEATPSDQTYRISAKPTPLFEQSVEVELPNVTLPLLATLRSPV